jgi:hypothetical protein
MSESKVTVQLTYHGDNPVVVSPHSISEAQAAFIKSWFDDVRVAVPSATSPDPTVQAPPNKMVVMGIEGSLPPNAAILTFGGLIGAIVGTVIGLFVWLLV